MLLVLVTSVVVLSGAGASTEVFRVGVAPRCESRACNPRMGNLALGRRVLTQTVCGNNGTEPYCAHTDPGLACGAAKCAKCNAALPHLSHLAAAMSDSSFRHPDTWWQSAEGVEAETVQLDLEAEFYFTHLIVVFRSPRPAAMTLERSQDFGRTWRLLQYYAANCSAAFGLPEGKAGSGRDGATCTSKYSKAYPCTRGEVIYRTLPKWESLDPFGPEGQQQLRVTNIRIRLLKLQPCPCQAKEPAPDGRDAPPTRHFAIYDLIVKGSCFCNGHAEQCVPAPGYQPIRDRTSHVVHGKCVCRHNTAGEHCERCTPLYNDRPWQPADGLTGAPHECRRCKCNGHAHSCHFDWAAWRESGQRSGGVCDCLHNTEGRQCESCKAGFYREPRRAHTAPDSCQLNKSQPQPDFFLRQRADVTLWAPWPSTRPATRSATPPTATASASLEWAGLTATGAWWDTGDSTSTAAARATAPETANLSRAIAFSVRICTTWRATPASQSGSSEWTSSSPPCTTQRSVSAKSSR
uniref:netrin-4 isoform X3 n=1 Tax=Doryrhamphus excisus TaxID=161450 RepID=UPI0025ADB0E8|nr:netrin-4 isoform X3 [Doryrhamphus excisus]